MSGLKTGNFKDLTINSNIVVGNSIEFGFNTGTTIKRNTDNNIVFNDSTFNNKTLLQALNQVNENITQYDDATQRITIGKMASIQFDVENNTSVMSIGNDLSINIGKSNCVNTIKLYNTGIKNSQKPKEKNYNQHTGGRPVGQITKGTGVRM